MILTPSISSNKFSSLKDNPQIIINSQKVNDSIIYKIKDNGIGFDMKYVDKLFYSFQQLNDPGEFEGTGVGLPIIHRIVSKHGGKVWVEAEPNKGATFYCSFPFNTDYSI